MAQQHPIYGWRRLCQPRLISIICFVSIISIEGLLIYLLSDRRLKVKRQTGEKLAATQVYRLQRQLDRSFGAVFALGLIWRQSQGTIANFDALAADLSESYGGIGHLQLAPGGIVSHIYPRLETDGSIGENLLQTSPDRREIFAAISSRSLTVTKPIELVTGDRVINAYLPIFIDGDPDKEQFWGLIKIQIPIDQLLQNSQFNQIVRSGYDYELEWLDPKTGDRETFVSSSVSSALGKQSDRVSHPVKIVNYNWVLTLNPKDPGESRTLLMLEILLILLFGCLLAYLIYRLLQQPAILQRQVELRVADLSASNQKLTAEITQRKSIEQALRESEERFRAIADATPIPLLISRSADGLILYGNQPLCQTFGIDPNTLIGSQTPNYYHDPADRATLVAELEQHQQLNNYELPVKKADGTLFWVAVYMRIIVFNGDRSIFAAFYDITERKQAEVQIQQALAKEQELNQLKSYFISMISHQFRTPLTKILGSAELLKSYSESWSQQKKWVYFDRIENTVKHTIEMLDDILSIAHAESGRLSFEPAPLNLSDFCQTLLQEFQIDDESDPQIILNIDQRLTEAENQLFLDAKLLEQILTNLLSNAIKYSPAETKVWFSVRIQAETVVFTVKDQGIGIPDQDIPQLFEPFHRCKNVKKIAGTGLGLTIVKKAADLHGAKINVESKSGVGTTFTVTIPV